MCELLNDKTIDLTIKSLALGGVAVAAWQLCMNRRAHLFSVYKEAMALLDDGKTRQARNWVYKMDRNLHDKEKWLDLTQEPSKPEQSPNQSNKTQWSDYEVKMCRWNDKQMAEITARSFDRLGLLVREGRIPVDLIASFYVTPILRSWYKLAPYIEAVRLDRKQRGHMWEFENLATKIVIREAKSGKGPWAGVKEHENLEAYKEPNGNNGINLLLLEHPEYWDSNYGPHENLWYLGFRHQIAYWLRFTNLRPRNSRNQERRKEQEDCG